MVCFAAAFFAGTDCFDYVYGGYQCGAGDDDGIYVEFFGIGTASDHGFLGIFDVAVAGGDAFGKLVDDFCAGYSTGYGADLCDVCR